MQNKLIKKYQNAPGPLIIKTDNTESNKPILKIPVNNEINWVQAEKEASQKAANKARSKQQHSEIITVPEVYNGNDQKEAFIRSFTGNRPTTTTTQVIGLSPVDPVGEFIVGGAVLDAPLKLLGKGIMYGAGRYLPKTTFGNWSRAKLISNNMTVRPYGFGRDYYTIGYDWDPNAFYHYERNILPKTLGGTRLYPRPSNLGEPKIWLSKGKPWLWNDRTLYKIPVDKVRTQSSKIIDPNHAEYYIADEIDLLQDGVEILSPMSIPDKGGFLTINGKKKFYVPTTKTTPETVMFEPIPIMKNNLTQHVQGQDAVKMFKEYGGIKIPEGSINGKELSTYVQEARIRYGLVGNTDISDQEIAEALYKHVNELGKNTKALNAQGEPQLLFRGDTKSYTELKDRLTPDELLSGTGTMDNSLGTLFLGDITNPDPSGVGRYLVGYKTTPYGTVASPSATGATTVGLYDEVAFAPQNWVKIGQGNTRRGPIGFTKAPAVNSSTGVNDLNAFVVKTGNVRNATNEIAVGNETLLINGNVGNYKGSKKLTGRQAMADHYRHVLDESKANKQGLLKSDIDAPLRDEHSSHEYFALPNWNKHNAKHILPYDLRIPRNWSDPNIYKIIIPFGIGVDAATNKKG